MKKREEDFESKKTKFYHTLLQVIMGLVLVWCVLWFVPVDNYFNFMGDLFGNNSGNFGITAGLTILVVLSFLVFSFGYYMINWCLNLSVAREEEYEIVMDKQEKDEEPVVTTVNSKKVTEEKAEVKPKAKTTSTAKKPTTTKSTTKKTTTAKKTTTTSTAKKTNTVKK